MEYCIDELALMVQLLILLKITVFKILQLLKEKITQLAVCWTMTINWAITKTI